MSAAAPLRASYSASTPYTWIPFHALHLDPIPHLTPGSHSTPYTWIPFLPLFSASPQTLLHFTSFEAKTLLLMSSSLQPSFFPSSIFSLAMFTDILYIYSQGILAVTQVKVGHMQELEINCWQKPLSFLI